MLFFIRLEPYKRYLNNLYLLRSVTSNVDIDYLNTMIVMILSVSRFEVYVQGIIFMVFEKQPRKRYSLELDSIEGGRKKNESDQFFDIIYS